MNIQPKKITKEICFFCGGLVEFMIAESMEDKGIKYKCVPCKFYYLILKEI